MNASTSSGTRSTLFASRRQFKKGCAAHALLSGQKSLVELTLPESCLCTAVALALGNINGTLAF